MNFKMERFFYLLGSLIIGSFFFIIGLFSIILPWSTWLQSLATQFILENNLVLSLFGLGFTLIGISIVIHTLTYSRKRYAIIKTGKFSTTIDENVIRHYLQDYWQKHFPQTQIPFNLYFKNHCLQIVADLPSLPLTEQKIFLENVKEDFSDLFGRFLGYPYDVHFIANFHRTDGAETYDISHGRKRRS